MDASNICKYIDNDLIHLIHNIVLLIKIAVPIVLVILGMLDFAKGVIASKEDEIKKGQQTFFKRVIAAIIVFFVVTIVQLLMSFISSDDSSIWTCANQILNGESNFEYASDKKCEIDSESLASEYEYCLTKADTSLCNTIFQQVCKNNRDFMWEYNNEYFSDDTDVAHGYKCKGSKTMYNGFYQSGLYSCITNGVGFEKCAPLFKNFCSE